MISRRAFLATAATPLIAAIGTEISAKRSALAHLLFNLFGSIVAMLMYRYYAWIVPWSAEGLTRQVANAHTIVQLTNAILLIPLVGPFSRLIVRIAPSRREEPEKSHLDDALLNTPEKAIVAAFLELRRMSTVARHMFQDTMKGFLDLDEAAEILGVSKSTLRRLDNLKQIRSYRIGTGKHRRFKKKDLLGYIEKNSNMESP